MSLPQDWAFNPQHTDLDETGKIGTGAETLADFACTVALTSPGTFPEDVEFGAGLSEQIIGGIGDASAIGEQLRGSVYSDDRVGDVTTNATTTAGALTLPIRITATEGPHRLSGALSADLIEEIIADEDFETP